MVTFTEKEADVSDSGSVSVSLKPGVYLAEVKHVKVKRDDQFSLGFKDTKSGELLCWDCLTFAGKALGIARKKIKALGIIPNEEGVWDFEPLELIGTRVKLTLVTETWKGTDQLKPDMDTAGFGYVEDDVPF